MPNDSHTLCRSCGRGTGREAVGNRPAQLAGSNVHLHVNYTLSNTVKSTPSPVGTKQSRNLHAQCEGGASGLQGDAPCSLWGLAAVRGPLPSLRGTPVIPSERLPLGHTQLSGGYLSCSKISFSKINSECSLAFSLRS